MKFMKKKIAMLFRLLWSTVFQWIFRNRNPYLGKFKIIRYNFIAKRPTKDLLVHVSVVDSTYYFYPLIKICYKKKFLALVIVPGEDDGAFFNVSKRFDYIVFRHAKRIVLERSNVPNVFLRCFPIYWSSVNNIYITDFDEVKYSCADFFKKFN